MLTFALLKPELVAFPSLCWQCVNRIYSSRLFNVLSATKINLEEYQLERFYVDHHDKYFYPRLIAHMQSGPVICMVLSGANAVQDWRNLIGPSKVYETVFTQPTTVRGSFGLTDFRNAVHGADCWALRIKKRYKTYGLTDSTYLNLFIERKDFLPVSYLASDSPEAAESEINILVPNTLKGLKSLDNLNVHKSLISANQLSKLIFPTLIDDGAYVKPDAFCDIDNEVV